VNISDVILMNLGKYLVNNCCSIICDVNLNVVNIEMYWFIVCNCIRVVYLRWSTDVKQTLY